MRRHTIQSEGNCRLHSLLPKPIRRHYNQPRYARWPDIQRRSRLDLPSASVTATLSVDWPRLYCPNHKHRTHYDVPRFDSQSVPRTRRTIDAKPIVDVSIGKQAVPTASVVATDTASYHDSGTRKASCIAFRPSSVGS